MGERQKQREEREAYGADPLTATWRGAHKADTSLVVTTPTRGSTGEAIQGLGKRSEAGKRRG